MEYAIPGVLFVFILSGLIVVKVQLAKRPTFGEANELYKDTKSCDVIHKSVDEKLACLPTIQETVTKIKTILEERDKK